LIILPTEVGIPKGDSVMSGFSPERLHEILKALLPASVRKLSIAYSGGLDSTVLLFALAKISDSFSVELRALHVDHQLQTSSAKWSQHCVSNAAALQIPCSVLRVEVESGAEGVEAAARKARYDAFRPLVGFDEALLTAHHADDQLEGVLLALMRGAGVTGLAATPAVQPFSSGLLVRPLLGFTRRELESWAREQQLQWIDDPTNDSIGFDRNFLRHHITPLLKQRWPAAAVTAVRASTHFAEASGLLEELAQMDVQTMVIGPCLDLSKLKQLSEARRRNVLRHWLKQQGIRAPSARKLASIDHDLLVAQSDRMPRIEVDNAVLQRHRDLLYCSGAHELMEVNSLQWDTSSQLQLPAGLGRLHLQAGQGEGVARARLPECVTVSFRDGGETLRVSPHQPTRPLKKLLQEANILPWWRSRLPLIYAGDRLVAVGDLWVDAGFAAAPGEPSWKILWLDKPEIEAIST
jgi:tRNA(Ile)-lysidine synthase